MNKILSWKIKAGVYAYIYLPDQTTHISTRIPEDSEKWHTIIGTISGWDESKYKHNFDIMADEVKKRYGVTIPWKDEYFNFGDGNYVNNVNIIMLAGDDGGGEGSGSIGDGIGGEKDVFDEFNDMIKAEIESMAAAINAKNEEVKAFVEQKVTETISEAKNTIAETNKELDNVRTDLLDKLSGATEAIERASALFDLGEGNITAEDIQNALISVDEYGGWMSAYSANVINMWTDYDAINKEMGSVGDAVDAKKGLFTKIATHIDTINETVGTVEDTVNASLGLAQTVATWVDASASTVTEAKSWIDAKNGIISDTLNYINGDEDDTRSLKHDMNVLSGTIISEASTRIDGRVTNVMSEINAMSASVTTQITQLGNGVDSALTSVGNKIEAVCGTVKTWITKTEELSGTAKDLRDEWTIQSGMIRSVSDMVAETDEYGCVLGYVVVEETDERIELYKRINDDVHESVMDLEPNVWYKIGTREKLSEELQPLASAYYSFKMGSYISQKADEVVMSVVNDTGKTAAIRLAIADDVATMGMIADKIIMSGDVVMGSMSALTANIGGILIGNGEIKTIKGVDDKTGMGSGQTSTFHLDGRTGGFSASGAYIRGEIEATSLKLGDIMIEDYLRSQIPNEENISKQIQSFIESDEFKSMLDDGLITHAELDEALSRLSGLTKEQIDEIRNMFDDIEIPNVSKTVDENGFLTVTYQNGTGEPVTWKTVESGDYLVANVTYGDGDGTSFLVSKEGLLQANNAVIHGKIYASEGYFQGDIKASSLRIGDTDIDEYVDGTIIGETIIGKNIQSSEKIKNTDTPIWRINNDGSGHLAEENILWDSSGNTEFRGSFRQIPENITIDNQASWDDEEESNNVFGGTSDICMGCALNQDKGILKTQYNHFYKGVVNTGSGGVPIAWDEPIIPSGKEQIGRKLIISNYCNNSGYTHRSLDFTIDDKYCFFENGLKTKFLTLGGNDVVELLGIGYDDVFIGWVVTNRIDLGGGVSDFKYGGTFYGLRQRIDVLDSSFPDWRSNYGHLGITELKDIKDNRVYLHPFMHTIIIPPETQTDIILTLPYNIDGDDKNNFIDGLHVGQEFEVWKLNSTSYKVTYELYKNPNAKIYYMYNAELKIFTDKMEHVTPGVYKAVWGGNMWYITFTNN